MKTSRKPSASHRCIFEDLESRQLMAGGAPLPSFSGTTLAFNTRLPQGPVLEIFKGFTSFGVSDASYDSSPQSAFHNGALRVSFNGSGLAANSSVVVQALKNGAVVASEIFFTHRSTSGLLNLRKLALTPGSYQFRAAGKLADGRDVFSAPATATVMPVTRLNGTFGAETIAYAGAPGSATVVFGLGGTDTLNLGVPFSAVASFNHRPIAGHLVPTFDQAIYAGTAFDHIRLNDGREIYFQGIENVQFRDRVRNLAVTPNDPSFAAQLTLHMTDMDSAWRFTNGSNRVLLASLDTGVLTAAGAPGGIHDLSLDRLITDPTDDDNFNNSGHGHRAISVMASTNDNADKVTGINWNSNVFVNDVYNGVNLQKAITDTIAHARANNLKVVFQGGIQGEFWLTSGGTRAQLENLISANRDIAVFAIAAGNGGPGGNLTDPNYLTSVSGVAKLQTNHTNVMSVGALNATGSTVVGGLTNATAVDLASYSNRGANLTMVAPTNNLAVDKLGNVGSFGGTSAANPFMAGVASLVWSANPELNGAEVRDVLRRSAMDLGAAGTDNTFGAGLVNADAAVRRAMALRVDARLATLNDFRIDAPLQQTLALGLPVTTISPRPPSMESSVWPHRSTTQDRGDVLAMTATYEKSPFLG